MILGTVRNPKEPLDRHPSGRMPFCCILVQFCDARLLEFLMEHRMDHDMMPLFDHGIYDMLYLYREEDAVLLRLQLHEHFSTK